MRKLLFLLMLLPMLVLSQTLPISVRATNGAAFSYTNGITIIRTSGFSTNVFPTVNTDLARGTALRKAANSLNPGDTLEVPAGTYRIVSPLEGLSNNIVFDFQPGAVIDSRAQIGSGYGAAIVPPHNMRCYNVTITNALRTPDNGEIQWGFGVTVQEPAFTNLYLENCVTYGDADGLLFIRHTNVCSATLVNCKSYSRFDNISVFALNSVTTNLVPTTVDIYNSVIHTEWPTINFADNNNIYGINCDLPGAVIRMFGGSITTLNAGPNTNITVCAASGNGARVELHSVALQSDGFFASSAPGNAYPTAVLLADNTYVPDDKVDVDSYVLRTGPYLAGSGITISTNGVITSSGGAPPGSTTQVIFNDAGAFGADAGLVYNKTTDSLTVNGIYYGNGYGLTNVTAFGSFTNNGTVWLSTNNTPSEPKPNGSYATVTDGRLYLRTNGLWVLVNPSGSGGGGSSTNLWFGSIEDSNGIYTTNSIDDGRVALRLFPQGGGVPMSLRVSNYAPERTDPLFDYWPQMFWHVDGSFTIPQDSGSRIQWKQDGTLNIIGATLSAVNITDIGSIDSIETIGSISYSPSIARTVWNQTSNTGNSGTTETILQLYATDSNVDMNINNQKLVSHWSVNTVGSGTATRRIKIYCGNTGDNTDTVLYDSGVVTLATGGLLVFETVIHRISATSYRATTALNTPTASSYPYTAYVEVTSGIDFEIQTFVHISGEADGVGAASDDIVVVQGYGEVKP